MYDSVTQQLDQVLQPWMLSRWAPSRLLHRPTESEKWKERALAVATYARTNKEVVFFRGMSSIAGFVLTPGLYTGVAIGFGCALFIHLALNKKEWEQATLTRMQILALGIIQMMLLILFVHPVTTSPVRQLLPYASGFLSAFYGPFIAVRKA